MNKLLLAIGSCLVFTLIISCNNSIVLTQADTNKSIIVRKNKELGTISIIQFPLRLIIENQSLLKKKFSSIDYDYGFNDKGSNIILIDKNKALYNYQLKVVSAREKKEYLVYTVHFTDSSRFIQNQLRPYAEKLSELNQDTLHIGTVAEFKKNHAELFKMLTENDTISIRYLKNENSGLGERIAIPANW